MTKRNTYIMVSHVVRPDGSNELRGVDLIDVRDVIDLIKYRMGVEEFNIHYGDDTDGKFRVVVNDSRRYRQWHRTVYRYFDDFDEAIEHFVKKYLREGKCVRKFKNKKYGNSEVHIDVYYDFDEAEIEGGSKFIDKDEYDFFVKLLDEKSEYIGTTSGLTQKIRSYYEPINGKKAK